MSYAFRRIVPQLFMQKDQPVQIQKALVIEGPNLSTEEINSNFTIPVQNITRPFNIDGNG